jgi:MFS family permease
MGGGLAAEVDSAGTGHGEITPLERVSRPWIANFTLAWFGYWMASLLPVQLLMPNQFAAIDPVNKVRDLAIAQGISGLVALVALPICGALCDRSRSRFGRRRVWIAGGTIVFAVALVGTGVQISWVGVVLFWAVATAGASAAMGGLTAVIADRVPEQQRGIISGAIYGPQALGVVIGIAVVSAFALTSGLSYALVGAALVVSSIPFVWKYREVARGNVPSLGLRAIAASMWINPRKNPEFGWAFGSRLLVNLGNSLGTCYLLYFLTDDLKIQYPDVPFLIVSIIYLVFAVISTYTAGWLSDRLGRRRIFVAVSAFLQAIAGFSLAAYPSYEMTLIAAALMGSGFGAYMAVDQAVVTHVLPDALSRAKDLGIMNVGSIVPTALAPLMAAVLITSHGGYPALFAVTGLFTIIGAFMVYRVKTVR